MDITCFMLLPSFAKDGIIADRVRNMYLSTASTVFYCYPVRYLNIAGARKKASSKFLPNLHMQVLILVMLNKLRCHPLLIFSHYLTQIHARNDKQCRSRSFGFFRSKLIWIYTVCKKQGISGFSRTRVKIAKPLPLVANSADDKLISFFLFFPENRMWHSCRLTPMGTLAF